MISKKPYIATLLSGLSGFASAVALASDLPTETISVTGSRLPVEALPGSLEVIDADQIEAWGNRNVSDVLRHVPGVDISNPAGAGGAELFMRGAEANFTTVLIDGVRVNNPVNNRGGSYDFSTMDVGGIDRVEIIRGPVSSVYGADALSGVVNIITRGASNEPFAALGGELGSHNYSRLYARAATPLSDRWSASLFAGHSKAPEEIEGYAARQDVVQGGLDYADADRSAAVRLRYGESEQTGFPDASGGPLFAASRELEHFDGKEWAASVDGRQRITQNWVGQLSVSAFERKEDAFTPAIFAGPMAITPTADGESRYRLQQAIFNNQFSLNRQLRLAAGAEVRRETGEQSGNVLFGTFEIPTSFDLDRTIAAGFVEGQYATLWGPEIFAGARFDDPDGFDSRVSLRLAAGYTIPKTRVHLHAGWTDGFKLPSFYALGDSLVGNPNLKEERAEAFELGVGVPLYQDKVNVDLTGYTAKYRDLIDFDFQTLQLVNRSCVRIDGAEAKLSIAPSEPLRFNLHVAYTDIKVDGTDASLPLRPEWRGGVSASWRPGAQWIVQSSAMVVGSSRASSIPTGDITLPSYTRVDLAVSRKIRDTYRLRFAVDNVLDEEYFEDAGIPSPGVLFRVGGEMSF